MNGTSYQICKVDEIEGSARDYPDRLGLFLNDGRCVLIKGGNPSIKIDHELYNVSSFTIDISTENVTANDYSPDDPGSSGGGVWQLNSNINRNKCSSLPSALDNDYRDATDREIGNAGEWYEDGKKKYGLLHPNWGNMTAFALDHPIFARLPDGSDAIYDPYLLLQENTIENPIPDGGGQTTLQSATKADDRNFEMVFQRDNVNDGDNFIKDDDGQYTTPGILSGEEQVLNESNLQSNRSNCSWLFVNIAIFCSNTDPTFLNEEHCHLSYSAVACSRVQRDHEDMVLVVTLDEGALSKLYNLTLHHVYAVENIIFSSNNTETVGSDPGTPMVFLPCAKNSFALPYWELSEEYQAIFGFTDRVLVERTSTRSRWIKESNYTKCDNPTVIIASSTSALFARLLSESTDTNPLLRDIIVYADETQCDQDDEVKHGMHVRDNDGVCWMNVHPEYLSVYDFTDFFTNYHSNNGWSNTTSGILSYPLDTPHHTMANWESVSFQHLNKIGRFMDMIEVVDLVEKMKMDDINKTDNGFSLIERTEASEITEVIANELGVVMLERQFYKTGRDGGVVVCGNRGEVASDASKTDTFELNNGGRLSPYEWVDYPSQKKTVWTMINLYENDQLRQRMAWSLYKILNVATIFNEDKGYNEGHLAFYDIFSYNAFGNYFDVLKEV
eukprot:2247720-Ditylum_brightwellii.AAC.1